MRRPSVTHWLIAWLIVTMSAHGLVLSVHRAGHAHYAPVFDLLRAGTDSTTTIQGNEACHQAALTCARVDPAGSGASQHEQSFCPACSALSALGHCATPPALVLAKIATTATLFAAPQVAAQRVSAILPFPRAPPANS